MVSQKSLIVAAVVVAVLVAVASSKALSRRTLTLAAGGASTVHARHMHPLRQAVLKAAIPDKVDWRLKGYVASPVDSGECPAVDIASAIATNIAGVSAVKNLKFTDVSLNEIVNCGIGSCMETLLDFDKVYEWFLTHTDGRVIAASGANSSSSATCNVTGTTAARISSFHRLPMDEKTMANYVAIYGPIAVGLYAVPFETYIGGVVTADQCGSSPAVDSTAAIVGFDTTASPPYWILKFAWGTSFGEGGYAKLEFGKGACAINQYAYSAFAAKL